MFLLWACTCTPAVQALPQGRWSLSGPGTTGVLDTTEGCRIALFGEGWDTGSASMRACTDVGEGWLELPFRSGAGDGAVVAQFDGATLTLELGAREGEFGVVLAAGKDEVDLAAAFETSDAALAADRAAWEAGVFRIQVGELLVGELELASDREVFLTLYDPSWMTDGRAQARVYEDGPELVLNFQVMPALDEGTGLIRLNRPLKLLVVPVAASPDPDDRLLGLVPGTVTDEERNAALAWALEEGGVREQAILVPLLEGLAAECELTGEWELLLQGYDVTVGRDDEGCLVEVDPTVVQHGRRMSARVRVDGPEESLLRPL